MSNSFTNFQGKLAGLLANIAGERILITSGEPLESRASAEADAGATRWRSLFDKHKTVDLPKLGHARACAVQTWNQASQTHPTLVATYHVTTNSGKQHVDSPSALELAVHCNQGTAIATAEFLPIWGKRPTDQLVGEALCHMIEMIVDPEKRIWSNFEPTCRLTYQVARAKSAWPVTLGQAERTCISEPSRSETAQPQFLLPGSFNPLHDGHRMMAGYVESKFNAHVELELSITNADKPPLDHLEIERRASQNFSPRSVWLTNAATFERKAKLFPGVTFLVGADTISRIGDPRFYGDRIDLMEKSIRYIANQGCKFLVFGRLDEKQFDVLSTLRLPDPLRAISEEIPEAKFRVDISSTTLREGPASRLF